jgi:hypothetical protein
MILALSYSLLVLVTSSLLVKLFDECQTFLSTFLGPPRMKKLKLWVLDTVLPHSRRSLSDDVEGQNPTSGFFQKPLRTRFHRD